MPEGSAPAHVATFSYSAKAAKPHNGADRELHPSLEAELALRRLYENRTLIRVSSLLALLAVVARGADQILLGALTQVQIVQAALVLASSMALAALAWGPWFGRLYLPLAVVLVPLRNSLVALTVAGVAARGQTEALMLLPMLAIGPFLVFGLTYRAALAGVAVTIGVYAAAAVTFGLEPALIVRSCLLLLLVTGACSVAAYTLERTARARFLETHAMAELAQHDALTNVKNRRVFDEHLERLWQRAAEERCVLAILLFDVDHFKAYNDRYGHQAGDRALRRVADVLQGFVTGPQDLLARYGGEEFAVLLYDVDAAAVRELAERMRKAVATLALEHRGSRVAVVTTSLGVAIVEPSLERRARGAVQLADEALYQAKTRGRNRVEILDSAAHEVLQTGVFAKGAGLR